VQLEFVHEAGSRQAFMVGNAGLSQVIPIEGSTVVSFLEILVTGAVQTTTIARDGAAVHSRHSYASNRFLQSQYVGTCQRT
jgi:hypothetical protein